MSKKVESEKKEFKESANNMPTQNNSQQYLLNILIILIAILIGMQIPKFMNENKSLNGNEFQSQDSDLSSQKPAESLIDMEKLYNEISERIKAEIRESLILKDRESNKKSDKVVTTTEELTKLQDAIINEKENVKAKTISVSDEIVVDDSAMKIQNDGKPFKIDLNEVKNKQVEEEKEAQLKNRKIQEGKEKARQAKEKKLQQTKKEDKIQVEKEEKNEEASVIKKTTEKTTVPDEVKNFPSTKIAQIKTKKMWIPIPGSNGGHRRVPAIDVKAGVEHDSSVKLTLYEEFLTPEECKSLIEAHEAHLKPFLKEKPIICFDSIATLRKNLKDLNRDNIAEIVTPLDFTEGTMCINQTFSRQLEKWGLKWSFSTAFYPGESKFSTRFGKLIEEATQLQETHGGKFQITSYPPGVGYKDHTDCTINSNEERDRYATFLVYLNTLGQDGGGQTKFTELGNDISPREGRALVWNNMNYETGKCEPKSKHNAAPVNHQVNKKYIIQRWYYYKNFYSLGKRQAETPIPQRPQNTAKVNCDGQDNGSCRLYDEWDSHHLINYQNVNKIY